jgi:hypothetical protein
VDTETEKRGVVIVRAFATNREPSEACRQGQGEGERTASPISVAVQKKQEVKKHVHVGLPINQA